MSDLIVYDNGGATADRYTVLYEPMGGNRWRALGLSDDPDWPLGFSQFGEAVAGDHLGERIGFDELPERVQRHVKERLGGNGE